MAKRKTASKSRKKSAGLFDELMTKMDEAVARFSQSGLAEVFTPPPKMECARCGTAFTKRDGGCWAPMLLDWHRLPSTGERIDGSCSNWALCSKCLELIDSAPAKVDTRASAAN